MGCDERPAEEPWSSLLSAFESGAGCEQLRRVRRGGVPSVLRSEAGSAEPAAGAVLPSDAGGYFEGLGSERGMAWRAADSLAIRSFLGLELDEAAPDHSTISRTRRLIDVETHERVFTWVLERLAKQGLLVGQTIGIDATTLEANAAMRSIVRRDTGASYEEYLKGLAKASGIKTPTREALARWIGGARRRLPTTTGRALGPRREDHEDEGRADALGPQGGARGRRGHGPIVAVTVQGADQGDTGTIGKTLEEAEQQLDTVMEEGELHPDGLCEVVADKGYHSDRTMVELEEQGLRSYVSEPDRGRRRWKDDILAQQAVYANRRRIRGERGKRLHRMRGELIERPFAHLYETGGMRRTHLRGHTNILKRLLIHSAGFNLGLVMRTSIGVGTPRGLQGLLQALLTSLARLTSSLGTVLDGLTGDLHSNPLRPCAYEPTCRVA